MHIMYLSHHHSADSLFHGHLQIVGTGALFLVEMVIRTDTRNASITIKTEATELLFQFVELWGNCLMGFFR